MKEKSEIIKELYEQINKIDSKISSLDGEKFMLMVKQDEILGELEKLGEKINFF